VVAERLGDAEAHAGGQESEPECATHDGSVISAARQEKILLLVFFDLNIRQWLEFSL